MVNSLYNIWISSSCSKMECCSSVFIANIHIKESATCIQLCSFNISILYHFTDSKRNFVSSCVNNFFFFFNCLSNADKNINCNLRSNLFCFILHPKIQMQYRECAMRSLKFKKNGKTRQFASSLALVKLQKERVHLKFTFKIYIYINFFAKHDKPYHFYFEWNHPKAYIPNDLPLMGKHHFLGAKTL